MGNNRSKYLIGATISAFAVVLSLVAIVPAVSETPTQTTALNALGHITITAVSPDGDVIAYRQSDNFVVNAALNRIQAFLFDTTGAPTDFKFLSLCGNAAVTERTDALCQGEMAQTRADGEQGGAFTTIIKTGTVAGVTTDVLAATIVIKANDADKTFDELGLFNAAAAGDMLSTATFSPAITVPIGTNVGMTYTITIGGG